MGPRIRRVFFIGVVCFTLSIARSWAQEPIVWQDVSSGIPEPQVLSIGVSPWDSQEIYAGTPKGIYRSYDRGSQWQQVLRVKGDDSNVYCIAFPQRGNSVIFAATGNGLYRSLDHGARWEQVLRTGKVGDRMVYWVETSAESEEEVYAATAVGLFFSQDRGRSWQKIHSTPNQAPIRRVITHPQNGALWIVTDPGIFYSSDHGKNWKRIWISPADLIEEPLAEPEEGFIDGSHSSQTVEHIALQSLEGGSFRLMAGTSFGLFAEDAHHHAWEVLPQFGVTARQIRFITADPKRRQGIFIGTDEGVFHWDGKEDHWESLSDGMLGSHVYELEFSSSGRELWAATDRGIFYTQLVPNGMNLEYPSETPNFLTPGEMIIRYRHEPTVEEVQQVAMRYAEVGPEKIQEWRRAAKTKAYLPDLSIDLNRQRDDNVDIDRGGTADPDRFISGPEEQTLEFDVSLTWDLGELVWNDDQTSIDVRSRLMVQLRDDILDEVTRFYFERRRLQIERELSPTQDLRQQVNQELRIQELTAQIDALTGGWFSRRLNQH